ncbi:hypothetical protein Tamer19_48120 [Cupriavidus sp. TA19]|nr:hypothetical protein Tamer19_48120 [Cupriavidus sp. TA19]
MQGMTVKGKVAFKRGKIKAMRDGAINKLMLADEGAKVRNRTWIEHSFHVVKNRVGLRKVR